MSSDSEVEDLLLLYALHKHKREQSESPVVKKRRRVWNNNLENRKQGKGEYNRLCLELTSDEDRFYEYFHMSQESFEMLHEKLEPRIGKLHTNFRRPISSRERLVVCLRFLASGGSYGAVATSFHVGRSTVSSIVKETCKEIYNVLQPQYMPEPSRKIWQASEKGYRDIWNFPNCVGSLDGRHVAIQCPVKRVCYEKKKSPIVLLSIIDPWCKFTAIDIGEYGPPDERDLFEETEFYKTYVQSLPNVLPSQSLPGNTSLVPRVFLADESFSLQPFLLRPYPKLVIRNDEAKRKFNEMLHQSYSVVDEAFDMLVKNWKILTRPIEADLPTGFDIVKAACCLHNYIINQGTQEESQDVAEGKPPVKKRGKKDKKFFTRHKLSNRRWTAVSASIREKFTAYFNK